MKSKTADTHCKPQHQQSVIRSVGAIMGLQVVSAGAFGIMSPILSIVMTEYFARLHRDGSPINCGAEPHDEACIAGSRKAAWLSSVFSAIGCMGNLVLSPMMGQASDFYGRKPFLILFQVLRLGIPFSVMYFMQPGGSITLYFLLRLVDSSCGVAGVTSAAIADVVALEDRATAFGILFASLFIGYSTSAFVAPFFSREHILQLAAVLFVLRVIWAIVLLPETLPLQKRMSRAHWVIENPFSLMSILFRDQLYIQSTCLIALTSFVMSGIFQIQAFYLNSIVGFDVNDFSKLMLLGGIMALVGQILLLKPLVSCVREKGVIVIALIASAVGSFGFAFTAYYPYKWLVYALSVPGCISDLSFPAISALKSINASEKEQGRLQGAIYGARSIFEALGPVVFASLYGAMTRQSLWSQALPYVMASFLYLVGVGVALSLPASKSPGAETTIATSVSIMSPRCGESPSAMYLETEDDGNNMKEDSNSDGVTYAPFRMEEDGVLAEPLLDSRAS